MWKIDGVKVMLCSAFIILSGCDSRQEDATSKINTIEIIDIQPPISEPLKPGQKVNLEVKLAYQLESNAATITLAILRVEGGLGGKSLTSNFAIIQKGKGELVLRESFRVPEENMLQVRIPLVPQQTGDTTAVASRFYKIIH